MNKKNLVLVGGYAGSGKTELARFLAHKLHAALLDKDSLTRGLVEIACEALIGNPDDRESRSYVRKVRPAEYDCLMTTTWDVLDNGGNVVVSAPFLQEITDELWINDVKNYTKKIKAQLGIIWVSCDVDIMYKRLVDRDAGRDAWKIENWPDYSRALDLELRPAYPHYEVVNNTVSLNQLKSDADSAIASLIEQWAGYQG